MIVREEVSEALGVIEPRRVERRQRVLGSHAELSQRAEPNSRAVVHSARVIGEHPREVIAQCASRLPRRLPRRLRRPPRNIGGPVGQRRRQHDDVVREVGRREEPASGGGTLLSRCPAAGAVHDRLT